MTNSTTDLSKIITAADLTDTKCSNSILLYFYIRIFFPLTIRNSHYSGSFKTQQIHTLSYLSSVTPSYSKVPYCPVLATASSSDILLLTPKAPDLLPGSRKAATSLSSTHTSLHTPCPAPVPTHRHIPALQGTHSSATSCSSSQASLCVSWLLPVLLHVHIRSLYRSNRASYSL